MNIGSFGKPEAPVQGRPASHARILPPANELEEQRTLVQTVSDTSVQLPANRVLSHTPAQSKSGGKSTCDRTKLNSRTLAEVTSADEWGDFDFDDDPSM